MIQCVYQNDETLEKCELYHFHYSEYFLPISTTNQNIEELNIKPTCEFVVG